MEYGAKRVTETLWGIWDEYEVEVTRDIAAGGDHPSVGGEGLADGVNEIETESEGEPQSGGGSEDAFAESDVWPLVRDQRGTDRKAWSFGL